MNRLCPQILVLVIAAWTVPLFAAGADVSFSAVKVMYSTNKIVFVDPQPIIYERAPGVSDLDANIALTIIGPTTLDACTNVYLTHPTGDAAAGEFVIVSAVEPTGARRLWTVDTVRKSLVQDLVFIDLHLLSLSVVDRISNRSWTVADLDEIVSTDGPRAHVEEWAEYLGVESEKGWLGDLWNAVKNKWNSMTPCEQVFLVGGILVCSAVGGVGGAIGCGVIFFVSEATMCFLDQVMPLEDRNRIYGGATCGLLSSVCSS